MSFQRVLSFDQVNKLETIFKSEVVSYGQSKVISNTNYTLMIRPNNSLIIDGMNTSTVIYDILKVLGINEYDGIFCSEAKDSDSIGYSLIVAVSVKMENYHLVDLPTDLDLLNDNDVIKLARELIKSLPYKFYFLNKQENAFLNKNKVSNIKLKALSYNTVILSLLNATKSKLPVFIEPFCSRESYLKNLNEQSKKYIDIVMLDRTSTNLGYLYAKIIARYLMIIKKQSLIKKTLS
jgi:ribonuclease HIII